MSTVLLNTPESSRDSSATSTPALATNVTGNVISTSPNSKNNNNTAATSLPSSPRAAETPVIVPRRIFVGGFPPATLEHELRSYFEKFGPVRDVKIIRDHAATSKGKYSYGFVTFETDEEAKKLIQLGKEQGSRAFEFRGRYLNVNEAIKKPPFNKLMAVDAIPPNGVVLQDAHGQLFSIQNGLAILANPDGYVVSQPQIATPTYPFVVQHPVYLAATAPPAPLKYAHQPAFAHVQPPPQSAPAIQHPHSAGPQHMHKNRFVFPPVQHQQPQFTGNQMAHLPPTPVASPVNPDSPSKNSGMNPHFTGNNPAITNLTTPYPPSVLGGTVNQQMPSSPYRWTTQTYAGPCTQMVYPPSNWPYVHDGNNSFQAVPHFQHFHHPPPPPPVGAGALPYYCSSDMGDYNSFSGMDHAHEVQTTVMDRRQSKHAYRMDQGASMKDN